MTPAQWRDGIAAKVTGTRNLHEAFGTGLNFFILLGSTGAITGNYGQGNYTASNTFQDAFARHLAVLGAPARAVDVGLVQNEGFTAENEAAGSFITSLGHRPHSLSELLAVLNYAVAHPVSESAEQAQILVGARRADPGSGTDEAARQRPDAKYSHVWSRASRQHHQQQAARAGAGGAGDVEAPAALGAATSPSAAVDAAYKGLRYKVAQLLDIPVKEIQPDRSVVSYGVDSLIELQLRNWITAHLGGHVTMLELMSPMSIVQLAEVVARRSRLVDAKVFAATAAE